VYLPTKRISGSSTPEKVVSSSLSKKSKTSIPSNLSLATEKSEPCQNLQDYSLLLYGEKKIGKTSLCSEFPEAGFFLFEPGGKGLRILPNECHDWATFKGYVKLLKENPEIYQNVVIDTVDAAYAKCFDYVAKREGFEHPTDENDFGKSWGKIKKEFVDTMDEIIATGRGVIFISHAEENEFQERSGSKYKKIIPSMPKQVREYLRAFVDIIAFYGYSGKERLVTIQGSDSVDAGHRVSEHFLTIDGEPVHSIHMGKDFKEAYQNFLAAFNNQQEDPHIPERKFALSEMPVERSKKK